MPHSRKYQKIKEKIDEQKVYSPAEAIDLIKNFRCAKFDESVEVHLKLSTNRQKDELVKGTVTLPHGTGKSKRIIAFVGPAKIEEAKKAGADLVGGLDLVEQIKQTKKVDFDLAVAEPSMMKDLSQIAKILGPRGLMPSPKTETVTNDLTKTIKALKGGKISFKNDKGGNIHQVIGKVSWPKEHLLENLKAFLTAVKKAKSVSGRSLLIQKIVLCSTMGPGIKIKF